MEIQEFTCDFYELFVWPRSIEMINIDTSKDKFNVLIGDRSFLFSYHVCSGLFFTHFYGYFDLQTVNF